MQPRVLDLSHHNTVTDWPDIVAAGIWGIIHKASQGTGYADPLFALRRTMATNTGLLWGAYHFGTGEDVNTQVDWFLKCSQPDDETLLALDYEPNPSSQMSIQQAVDFLHSIEDEMGRKAVLYSGSSLKENIDSLGPIDRTYLTSHRLWLPQYGPVAHVPVGFASWWLWQYTDGIVNADKTPIPGLSGLIDRNTYSGTIEQLKGEWAS